MRLKTEMLLVLLTIGIERHDNASATSHVRFNRRRCCCYHHHDSSHINRRITRPLCFTVNQYPYW